MPSPSAAAGGNVFHVITPYALNSRFLKYIFLFITVFTQNSSSLFDTKTDSKKFQLETLRSSKTQSVLSRA